MRPPSGAHLTHGNCRSAPIRRAGQRGPCVDNRHAGTDLASIPPPRNRRRAQPPPASVRGGGWAGGRYVRDGNGFEKQRLPVPVPEVTLLLVRCILSEVPPYHTTNWVEPRFENRGTSQKHDVFPSQPFWPLYEERRIKNMRRRAIISSRPPPPSWG